MAYPDDRKYTNDHEWLRQSGDSAEVGITDFAQQQLGDVVYVELPDVGSTMTAGTVFGTIESVKAVSELFAPVSGQVTEINTSLKDRPDHVNSKPHETWMVKVKMNNSGEVAEVNASLKDRPDHVNSKPHETWMLKVKLADTGELGSLMDAGAYEQLIQK